MSNNEMIIKRRKLSRQIKATIVDLGIRDSDAAYLIKNLLFNNTKSDLVKIVERDDIPIAVQIFAHALLDDYKHGNINKTASMMQWAFDKTPERKETDLNELTEEEIDEQIKLLTEKEL